MDPLITVAVIGFAGQICVALISTIVSFRNGQKIDTNATKLDENTSMTASTHKIVNSQRTVMEERIEQLEKMLTEVKAATSKGNGK
jgi:hypothetical protein